MRDNKKWQWMLLGCLAWVLAACGGMQPTQSKKTMTLKEAFADKFLVGVAVNVDQSSGRDTTAVEIVKKHFNSIVAEDCMKSENIHPEENRYDFEEPDAFVRFGEENRMFIIGHCLIWHSQLAPWFCVDKEGKPVTAEVLKQRMKDHIYTIVGRYRGRIKGWDVVNEAFIEDGSYRKTPFYEILGEEYIPLAFQYAHEADPEAELYYNDYGMNQAGRREAVVRLVKQLKERGLRIDAIGMQGHMGMDYPDMGEFEKSLVAFADAGVKVMITEWDMSALPTVNQTANISDTVAFMKEMNPYPEGLPDSVSRHWNARMNAFLQLFLRHSDVITRVTAWGLTDGNSWKNNHPVRGRTEYPLLFDRNYQLKPFLREYVDPKKACFDSFLYTVPGEEENVDSTAISNPLLPGCYPDPSICRVGEDYYLVNSSFAFYPGIPIWHSTDLRHWEQLGYVLNRPSQLLLKDEVAIRQGIYAPALSYNPHNKLFYLITTAVGFGGNFYVTTDDPKKGEWSDPVFLPEVGGIDPSFLFDEDGKAYIVNNDAPKGTPRYDGHRAIWIREFDWKNGRTVGLPRVLVDGGVNPAEKPIWIEGPHLYHINGTYYLMAAEGGTSIWHSEVIFSSSSPFGPFKPCQTNPILTQRHLPADRPAPVTCAGHADLVQTPEGDWYAIFLAVRPYKGDYDVMGRETFLLPVEWVDGQPIILPSDETITYRVKPVPPTPLWTSEGLAKEAFFIRTPNSSFYEINSDGRLALTARTVSLGEGQPAAIGRWVTEWNFSAQTGVEFQPESPSDFAGLILFQDDECFVRFGKSLAPDGTPCLTLDAYSKGRLHHTAQLPLQGSEATQRLYLRVTGQPQADPQGVFYTFAYASRPEGEWTAVGEPVSADLLSTKVAGGFTGTLVGIYATASYEQLPQP